MDFLAGLALVFTLANAECCFSRKPYVLDITLRSDMPASSGLSVSGKSVDVLTDAANVSLVATLLVNCTKFTQVMLTWNKNGSQILAPSGQLGSLSHSICTGNSRKTLICSFELPLSSLSEGMSENYTVKASEDGCPPQAATTVVTAGRARPLKFTSSLDRVIYCSASNMTATLLYRATGFPRPVYSINCSGFSYESGPSESGFFALPPALCHSRQKVNCQAVASNGNLSTALSAVTMIVPAEDRADCSQLLAPTSSALPSFGFVSCPPAVVSTDSYVIDGMVVLQYSAVGALYYSLNCSYYGAVSGKSFSSDSGCFEIPSPQCGTNATCYAIASLGRYEGISRSTVLLASVTNCKPSAYPVSKEQLDITLMACTTALTAAGVLALTTAAISYWQRRRLTCLFRQPRHDTGQAEDYTEKSYLNECHVNCSHSHEMPAAAADRGSASNAGLCRGLQSQSSTQLHHFGLPVHICPAIAQFNAGGTRDLETDCGCNSPAGAQQPNCRISRLMSECRFLSNPSNHLVPSPSAANPSTLIFISNTNVQLGNSNTMIINNGNTDHLSSSSNEDSPGHLPEAEHDCVPDIRPLSNCSTLPELGCQGFGVCQSSPRLEVKFDIS